MNCRICGGHATERFELGPYRILSCDACGFGWPEPAPTVEQLQAFYSGCHHPQAMDDSLNRAERQRVAARLRQLAPKARTLLDVGCGFGHSLDAARGQGFETYGVEMDAQRAAATGAKGHRIEQGLLTGASFGGRRFDAVILSHVVEHLPDPLAMLRAIHDVLHDGGIVYVACPNFRCLRARLAKAHYNHYCPPEHISYFTPQSLHLAASQAGLRPLRFSLATQTLHVKQLLAFFMYAQFLRPAIYHSPAEALFAPRFVSGRAAAPKRAMYQLILGASWLLRPLVNALGGEHIESYWQRI